MKNRLKEVRMKEFMMSAIEFSKMLDVKKSTYSHQRMLLISDMTGT